ncbi:MAG: protein-glutamate O-methyltransferase [Thermodesulfobacteriota bacterium]|nr:protein-glutamate O-methyltransferase [Thermodesulfobacteriota bacterium]
MAKKQQKIFKRIIDIVYRESGIVLKDKPELLEARLAGLARKKGYSGPQDILERLESDETGEAVIELLDQVSTNLTYFFREPAHFDFVSKVFLPRLLAGKKARREQRIRFWSAACSSGEEPYSLAMTVREHLAGETGWDVKILATDISTKVLQKGIEGRYSRQEVLRASPQIVQSFFNRKGDHKNPIYEVTDEIKEMVTFRRLNLLDDSYPFTTPFDLIVCRNVMIYFDFKTKQALLRRFHKYMGEGAVLFTGHSESLYGFEHFFHRVQVAVYQK